MRRIAHLNRTNRSSWVSLAIVLIAAVTFLSGGTSGQPNGHDEAVIEIVWDGGGMVWPHGKLSYLTITQSGASTFHKAVGDRVILESKHLGASDVQKLQEWIETKPVIALPREYVSSAQTLDYAILLTVRLRESKGTIRELKFVNLEPQDLVYSSSLREFICRIEEYRPQAGFAVFGARKCSTGQGARSAPRPRKRS